MFGTTYKEKCTIQESADEIQSLRSRVQMLEDYINTTERVNWNYETQEDEYYIRPGLLDSVEKIKALLNEVIDHVYAEKK